VEENTVSTTRGRITDRLNGIHVYGLARRADLADPDGPDSPGARWLELVRDSTVETLDYIADDELTPDGIAGAWQRDWPHEAADAAVPVYTAERWRVFTDLAAWQVDVSDLAGGGEDMTTLAGFALYEAARTLIAALEEDATEAVEDASE
jgi:hypothetical protein